MRWTSSGPPAVISVVMALVLAGCTETQPRIATQAPETDSANSRLYITGLVMDDELAPIVAASIELVGRNESNTTDTNGRFLFQGLLAGVYDIRVEKAGFQTREKRFELSDADGFLDLEMGLVSIPVTKARAESFNLNGLIACSLAYAEPANIGFPHEYSVCRNIQGSGDKTALDFYVTSGVQALLVETVWTATVPTANNLKVRISPGPGGGAFTDGPLVGEARGPSTLRVEVDRSALLDAKARGIDCLGGCELASMTAASPLLGTPVDAGLAVQQDYQQWVTAFYFQDMPDGATALIED